MIRATILMTVLLIIMVGCIDRVTSLSHRPDNHHVAPAVTSHQKLAPRAFDFAYKKREAYTERNYGKRLLQRTRGR